ncbi:MAG: hypothetical protein M1827_000679 [Pycnora praestabilis]|nr:MAG: hypothetical protein M1827_000679 [Pycnora praestabilis]
MDSWSNDQVDVSLHCPPSSIDADHVKAMKRNGNTNSNRTYNPQNRRPSIPLDVDEVDGAMERYIRQKYEHRGLSGGNARPPVRHNTGSTSSEDHPPPLPPKPTSRFRFGLRSASSTLPATRPAYDPPPTSPDGRRGFARSPSPVRVNKASRVFGTSVGTTGESLESKLAMLREMGFPDDKRNSTILKGLSGDIEKTIASLVRLGEGDAPASRTVASPKSTNLEQSGQPEQGITGLSGYRRPQADRPPQISSTAADEAPSQNNEAQTLMQSNPYNPFNVPSQQGPQTQPLEQSFQNFHISQPLFPNATGGFPVQQHHQVPYQQSLTPPVPHIPQQFFYSNASYQDHSQLQMQQRPTNENYNPFLQSSQSQSQSQPQSQPQPQPQPQPHSYVTHAPSNPYTLQYSNPTYMEIQQPEAQQAQQYGYTVQNAQHGVQQPYQSPPPPPPQQQQYQPQSQALLPQQTGRVDKSSIMALYNFPQLAPSLPPPFTSDSTLPTTNHPSAPPVPKLPSGIPTTQSQRSVSSPAGPSAGSRNPFLSSGGPDFASNGFAKPMQTNGGGRHVSQESVDVGGWQSGRHSPDAFASLSARSVR